MAALQENINVDAVLVGRYLIYVFSLVTQNSPPSLGVLSANISHLSDLKPPLGIIWTAPVIKAGLIGLINKIVCNLAVTSKTPIRVIFVSLLSSN